MIARLQTGDAVIHQFEPDDQQHRVGNLEKEAVRYAIVQPDAHADANRCQRHEDQRRLDSAGVELARPGIRSEFDVISARTKSLIFT